MRKRRGAVQSHPITLLCRCTYWIRETKCTFHSVRAGRNERSEVPVSFPTFGFDTFLYIHHPSRLVQISPSRACLLNVFSSYIFDIESEDEASR